MGTVAAIIGAITALLGIIKAILSYFPAPGSDQIKKQFDGDLNDAFKKAEDPKNPDPSDLSRLINK